MKGFVLVLYFHSGHNENMILRNNTVSYVYDLDLRMQKLKSYVSMYPSQVRSDPGGEKEI